MIQESRESKCIALGVVFEDVGTQLSLGKEGTVGYHTKYETIHDSSLESGNITRGMYIYVDRASQCAFITQQEQRSVERHYCYFSFKLNL